MPRISIRKQNLLRFDRHWMNKNKRQNKEDAHSPRGASSHTMVSGGRGIDAASAIASRGLSSMPFFGAGPRAVMLPGTAGRSAVSASAAGRTSIPSSAAGRISVATGAAASMFVCRPAFRVVMIRTLLMVLILLEVHPVFFAIFPMFFTLPLEELHPFQMEMILVNMDFHSWHLNGR